MTAALTVLDGLNDPGSPGWWLDYLARKFDARDTTYDLTVDNLMQQPVWPVRTRRQRFNLLWSYYIGSPPLPQVAQDFTDTFQSVLRKGRATYAPMCVTSMLDRMELLGVRTGVSGAGPRGDDVARRIMSSSGFAAVFKDLLTYVFAMSEGYLMVVPAMPDAADRTPLITAEDPRFCVGEPDPQNPTQLRAALKVGFDPVLSQEVAWLFVGGRRYKAVRQSAEYFNRGFSASGFQWDEDDGGSDGVLLPELEGIGQVPVIKFGNARKMGEYEPHLDLLDRINDTILQRIVITWYQSFRQRAVIADLEGAEDDQDSPVEEIDWNDVFRADPGALWRVPAGSQFWESGQTDLTPIITSIRDDVKEFAAVTSTPLHLITPDAAQGSAEGAALMREGLVFKVKDRRARINPGLVEAFKLAFAFAGEPQRATDIEMLWGAIESYSLGEKTNAVAQTRGILSRQRQLTDLMEMEPDEIVANEEELLQDQILYAQLTVPPPPTIVRMTEQVTDKSQPGQLAPTATAVP